MVLVLVSSLPADKHPSRAAISPLPLHSRISFIIVNVEHSTSQLQIIPSIIKLHITRLKYTIAFTVYLQQTSQSLPFFIKRKRAELKH